MNKKAALLAVLITIGQQTVVSADNNAPSDSVNLNEVTVTGTRNATDTRYLPTTISVINRQKLTENYRQSVLPTISEQVPGLFVTSRGVLGYGVSTGSAGSIKVRGIGSGASLLVLVDGLPQYAGLMGHPIADAYQTMLADKVEVLRGPASLFYGSNAMGGVVNIVTRKPQHDGSRTYVNMQAGSYGTIEGGITTTTRKNKLQSILGFNYGKTDGHRPNSQFQQYSGFAKLGYDISNNWTLSGDLNLTHFESSNPGTVSAPINDNDSRITRGMASAALTNDYGWTSGAVRVFYNWGHHEVNDGYENGEQPLAYLYKHNDLMGGVSIYQSASLFSGNRITVGLDYQHFGGKAWNDSLTNAGFSVLGDKTIDEFAGYADFRQDIASWLTLDAGLRIDHHSTTGTELIPQGGLTFRLSDQSELKAMVSKGFRNPTIRELYMFRPANNELKPERIMNYELGYSQRLLENKLKIAANVFYLKADNLINTVMQDGRRININTGEAENWGIELETAFTIAANLSVNANYSFLHMTNHIEGAPEHKLYIGGNYSISRLSLTTGLQYISGLYTATGANEKKESFVLWNLTASYRMAQGVQLFVRGENLLAQCYEINSGFPMPKATFMGGINWAF